MCVYVCVKTIFLIHIFLRKQKHHEKSWLWEIEFFLQIKNVYQDSEILLLKLPTLIRYIFFSVYPANDK